MSPSPNDENPTEPESAEPPEAPTLEGLHLDKEQVEHTSGPIRRYASNQPQGGDVGGETPFIADTPFAANTPGFGGETPFFMGATDAQFDFEMDDTDGIPTGLPDLLHLDDLSVPPVTRDAAPATFDVEAGDDFVADTDDVAPEPSGLTEEEVAARVATQVQEIVQTAVNNAVEQAIHTERTQAAERQKKKLADARMMTFGVAVFMASAVWGILLALALYYEALQV